MTRNLLIIMMNLTVQRQQLKAIASSASNTWGLLLLMGLLGYSLVEVPRSLWKSAIPTQRLQLAYFKAAKISADKCQAEEALDDVLDVRPLYIHLTNN